MVHYTMLGAKFVFNHVDQLALTAIKAASGEPFVIMFNRDLGGHKVYPSVMTRNEARLFWEGGLAKRFHLNALGHLNWERGFPSLAHLAS